MIRTIARPSDRRQFGRRWTDVHAWIVIDGRPRISCQVRNFSEGGALLVVKDAQSLPYTFVLDIDHIKFRVGCQACHRESDNLGVRFIDVDLVTEIGPIWTIDELMKRAEALADQRLAS